MANFVLLSDARVAAVPVHECDEPLIDLRDAGDLEVDGRQADPEGAYAHVRTEPLSGCGQLRTRYRPGTGSWLSRATGPRSLARRRDHARLARPRPNPPMPLPCSRDR